MAESDNILVIMRQKLDQTLLLNALPSPAAYTRVLLQSGQFTAADLLAGTSLDTAALRHRDHLTVGEQIRIFRNAQALAAGTGVANEWAIRYGRRLHVNSHGPLGFAALSAPTMGDGLDVLAEFARIRGPYFEYQGSVTDGWYALEVLPTEAVPDELRAPLIDIVMQVALSLTETVLGAAAEQVAIRLNRPAPRDIDEFQRQYRGTCVFDASVDALVLPVELRAVPCPLHEETTYRAALAQCREALDRLLTPDDVLARANNWLAARFDQLLAETTPAGVEIVLPRLDDLADALAMSPRTLNRRLKDQNTSFSRLRDAHQHALACRLLADARFTAAEVGTRLGYGDPSNFTRAFRRLSGMSPGQFRRT